MGLRLFLMLFVIRAVHLAPAKHVYEGVGQFKTAAKPAAAFRNLRQAVSVNGFGQGTLGGQQGAFGNQQQFGGGDLSANGFGQAQNFAQGQNSAFGQSTGLNGGAVLGQNFGGFNAQSQNLGFGQNQGLGLQLGQGQLQQQNFGFGQAAGQNQGFGFQLGQGQVGFGQAAGQDQGLGLQLGQGQLQQQSFGFGQANGQDQGLGFQLGQGQLQQQSFGFGQAVGQNQGLDFQGQAGANQGFDQNQGFAQGFDQNGSPAGLDQGFGQAQGGAAFNQGFDQSQSFGQNGGQQDPGLNQADLDQGFNQQPLDNSAGFQQQQFGPTAASPAGQPNNQDLINSFGGSNDRQQEPVTIGGKNKHQNQQGISQTDQAGLNNQHSNGPVVTKDFYLHAAPEDLEDDELELKKLKLGPSRKHYNVVFIKAPSLSAKSAAIKLLQAKNEEKTIVYVLSKQLDSAEIRANIKSLPVHASKPEVFFIKYRTPEEAQFAQQKIQAQFDSLGGTSRVSDEGFSPITSVVGALDGDDQQQFQNGQSDQFDNSQQQGSQQGQDGGDPGFQFPTAPGGQFPSAQRKQQFENGKDQFSSNGGEQQINSGEGLIQPRIGNGDKGILDGEALGKIQNFGAAGQVGSSTLNKRLSPTNKPRH